MLASAGNSDRILEVADRGWGWAEGTGAAASVTELTALIAAPALNLAIVDEGAAVTQAGDDLGGSHDLSDWPRLRAIAA